MERKRLQPQHDKCADIFGGHPSMGSLRARRGPEKGPLEAKMRFSRFFVKKRYRRDIRGGYGDGKSQRRAGETLVF